MSPESVINYCRDFGESETLCKAIATESQPIEPAMPPVGSEMAVGLPWWLLVALPIAGVFAALQHLTKDQPSYTVPTLAFNGVADLPRYQPPVLNMAQTLDMVPAQPVSPQPITTVAYSRHEPPQTPATRGEEFHHSPQNEAPKPGADVVPQINTLSSPFDMAGYMADNLGPTLITATPRTGKGMILQQFWRLVKDRGVSVWVLQPKPSPQELCYWDGVDRFLPIMLENYDIDSPDIAQQMKDFVFEWRAQQHRPTVLIVDELVKIQACQPKLYEWLKSQILVEMSSGETDSRYVYLVTQSPLVGDIGLSGGNRAIMNLVALARKDKPEHLNSLTRSMTSVPKPDSNLYQRSESPNKSIVYHSNLGRWYPMPNMAVPKGDPVLRAFQNWYTEKDGNVTFDEFKNANVFKKFTRSRAEFERLLEAVS